MLFHSKNLVFYTKLWDVQKKKNLIYVKKGINETIAEDSQTLNLVYKVFKLCVQRQPCLKTKGNLRTVSDQI